MRAEERYDSRERVRKAIKAVRLARTPRYRRGLRHHVAAAIEHDVVPLPPNLRSVIDVGSHTGQFALFALERFDAAHVFCIEPLAGPRERMAAALTEPDRSRVTVIPFAAAGQDGSVAMHVSKADDSSSLLPIGRRYVAAFPGTEEARGETVPARRLDQLIPELECPSLLKVDVQGYELQVLEGAARLIGELDYMLIECSFVELYLGQALAGEVVSHVHEHGFELAGVYGVKRDRAGHCLQADLFFSRAQS